MCLIYGKAFLCLNVKDDNLSKMVIAKFVLIVLIVQITKICTVQTSGAGEGSNILTWRQVPQFCSCCCTAIFRTSKELFVAFHGHPKECQPLLKLSPSGLWLPYGLPTNSSPWHSQGPFHEDYGLLNCFSLWSGHCGHLLSSCMGYAIHLCPSLSP